MTQAKRTRVGGHYAAQGHSGSLLLGHIAFSYSHETQLIDTRIGCTALTLKSYPVASFMHPSIIFALLTYYCRDYYIPTRKNNFWSNNQSIDVETQQRNYQCNALVNEAVPLFDGIHVAQAWNPQRKFIVIFCSLSNKAVKR